MPRTPLETLLDRFESDAPWRLDAARAELGEAFSALDRASVLRRAEPLDAWWCDACSEPHPVALSSDDGAGSRLYFCGELGDVAVPAPRTEQIAISADRFAEACLRALTSEGARLRRREPDWLWEADLDGAPLQPPVYVARNFYEPARWELLRRYLARAGARAAAVVYAAREPGLELSLPPPLELRWLGGALVLDGDGLRAAPGVQRVTGNKAAPTGRPPHAPGRVTALFEELIATGQAESVLGRNATAIEALLRDEARNGGVKPLSVGRIANLIRDRHNEVFGKSAKVADQARNTPRN